ncbi:MAG: SpoIVB peptidase S55 domain-containing protein [Armatimonadota bacterium]
MKRLFIITFLFIFLSLSFVACFSDAPIMPLGEIVPGMKGYGLTVFNGTKIEKFPVTVLGVSRKYNDGISTILIEVDGGYCLQNQTGPVAGMSGSPVYIDGKLIGGIAYGSPFSKTTIFGVQPIEEMLKVLNKPSKAAGTSSGAGRKITIEGKEYKNVKILNSCDAEKAKKEKENSSLVMTPLKTLFQVNGLSEKNIDALNEKFSDIAVFKNTGGGSYYKDAEYELSPGAAVGVQLVKGDIDVSSAGTLTYSKDGKFLAFAHSMLNLGSVDMPLSVFYVQAIVPSYFISTKVASPIKEIGTLTNDTWVAISGSFGASAPMLPMTINLKDGPKVKKFNIEVARIDHPIVSFVMSSAIGEAANAALIGDSAGAAKADIKFTLSDGRVIEYSDVFYDRLGPLYNIQSVFGVLAGIIKENEFEKVSFKDVDVDIEFIDKNLTARIEKIYLDKNKIDKGGDIFLHVVIKPYNGKVFEKTFKAEVPKSIQAGEINIGACGGQVFDLLEKRLHLPRKKITDFNQLVNRIETIEKNNQLVIKFVYPTDTVNISGRSYPFMPKYLVGILASSSQSIIEQEPNVQTQTLDTPYIITNFETTWVSVSQEVLKEKKKEDTAPEEESPAEEESQKESLCTRKFNFLMLNENGKPAEDTNKAEDEKDKDKEKDAAEKELKKEEVKDKKEETPKEDKDKVVPLTSFTSKDTEVKEFFAGQIKETAISDAGYITLSKEKDILYKPDSNFIYCSDYSSKLKSLIIADQDGNIINAGTGRVLATLPGGIITSVLNLPDGSILASSAPSGKIFKVSPYGGEVLFASLPVKYIWQLKYNNDAVWAATGIPAKLYKISLSGHAAEYASADDLHVKALTFKSGLPVIGTAERGIIYAVNGPGRLTPVCQCEGEAVLDLCADSRGNIYAACGHSLIKISKLGAFYGYSVKEDYITSVEVDENDEPVFGTAKSAKIYKLKKNEEILYLHDLKCGEIFDFSKDSSGNIYFTTGDYASAGVLKTGCAPKGEFISRVFDLKNTSDMGVFECEKNTPSAASVSVYTRSGQSADPDSKWSGWRSLNFSGGKAMIKSPPAEYFQYKVELKSGNSSAAPKFFGASFKHKPLFKTPFLVFLFPYTFDAWSGEKDIEWICGDTSLDLVRFSLYYRSEASNNWTEIDMDIPVSLKKKDMKNGNNPVSADMAYTWDTKKIPDGKYRIRLTAYNVLDKNLKAEMVSNPFRICNTKPEIKVVNKTVKDNILTVEGMITCKNVLPEYVSFSFDKKSWYTAIPVNGMFNNFEDFFIIKAAIPKDSKNRKAYIRAEDASGNKAEKEIDI